MTRQVFDKEIEKVSGIIGPECPDAVKEFLWDRFHFQDPESMRIFFMICFYFLNRGET